MKYYVATNKGVHAFESDGSQDFLITGSMRPMTLEEVHQHLYPAPTQAQLEAEARSWRDAELARADIELNKVQDGDGVGTVTAWRAYRSALRKWPETLDWPNSIKPIAPDYKE
jgi:hypothetical protein